MNVIKNVIAKSILNKYTVYDNVLQYTDESTENKFERLYGLLNQLERLS